MRYIIMIIGATASLGLIAVSITMNFRFGQLLGRTEVDGLIYGVASGCADGLKVILPFSIAESWRQNRISVASASMTLFLIFSIYSVTSSLGFSATNRAETKGERLKASSEYNNLQKSYRRLIKQRDSLPAFRPSASLQGLLRASEQNYRWQTTSSCTDATVGPSREFCDSYFRIKAELGVAKKAEKLDKKIDVVSNELKKYKGGLITSGKVDPQASMLQSITGLSAGGVETALTIILTLLVELGSGLGLFATFGTKSRELRNAALIVDQTEKNIEGLQQQWIEQQLVQVPGSSIAIDLLYYDYGCWLYRHSSRPAISYREFPKWLSQQGYDQQEEIEGRIHICEIALADDCHALRSIPEKHPQNTREAGSSIHTTRL